MCEFGKLERTVNKRARILLISEDDFSEDKIFTNFELFKLQFTFVAEPSPNAFSAWVTETHDMLEKVNVLEECRPLVGGFNQQALNRLFGQIVLKQHIDAVVVVGLMGCTIDISRVASLIGIPAIIVLDESAHAIFGQGEQSTDIWVKDALDRASALLCKPDHFDSWQEQLLGSKKLALIETLPEQLRSITEIRSVARQFDYATYEFCLRDHPLLSKMQQGDAFHFKGCQNVLDLGCGSGIFLDVLRKNGINACGVERDPVIAEYGRGMGLEIITDDALEFLHKTTLRFDGIYCSHFVEHLPFEVVQKLISLLARVLEDNGILVLVFPDPESIRSQLLGFWRDPEHVRFYHPELVTSLAQSVGLRCEWSSYDEQPHHIVSFEEQPPEIDVLPELSIRTPSEDYSWRQRILALFGLVSTGKHKVVQDDLFALREDIRQLTEKQNRILNQLKDRTDSLWAVNRTWAWNDNAVLKLRKGNGQ